MLNSLTKLSIVIWLHLSKLKSTWCHSIITLFDFAKCPKILYTKVSEKLAYANSANPDQTAPEGAVWSGSTLFAIPLIILRSSCMKSKS